MSVVIVDNGYGVGMIDNMKAVLIAKERTIFSEDAFCEIVIWQVPSPVAGSAHGFKYRLALVVRGECILRYDNERGKGDHRHIDDCEEPFEFTTLDALLVGFQRDMERLLK